MRALSLLASLATVVSILAAGYALSLDSSMKYFGGCVSADSGLSRCVLMPTVDAWFVWMAMALGLIMVVSLGKWVWRKTGTLPK